jgi:hypothetical protein
LVSPIPDERRSGAVCWGRARGLAHIEESESKKGRKGGMLYRSQIERARVREEADTPSGGACGWT